VSAQRSFSDNFESGKVTKWTQDANRDLCQPVQRSIDGSAPHRGQYMLQCNWNGTVAWNAPNAFSTVTLPQGQWIYKSEFLLRLRIKYDQDVSHTFGGKVLRSFPADGLDGCYLIAHMQTPGWPSTERLGRPSTESQDRPSGVRARRSVITRGTSWRST
jgi:hypothetical protein